MKISARLLSLSAAALCLLAVLPATAQRGGGGGRIPSGVAISPDGATVAWSAGGREGSQIHLTAVADPDPAKEKIVVPNGATNCSNNSPMWSPDGQWLAYTSTCTSKEEKPGQPQIFLWSKASGESKQLTHVVGNFHEAAWSPDGKSIAFLFVENATRSAGALDAMKPWAGVIGEDGVEVQRLYGVDVATGTGSWLSPLTLHVYEFGWAPNSHEVAYIAADSPGENNWWIAQLWAAPVHIGPDTVGPQPRSVLAPQKISGPLHGLQIAVPRWSPDGKRIAFIGGLMSDQGSTGGDVWVVDAKGGAPTDITPGIDGTPTYEVWFDDHTLGFVEDRSGHTLFQAWDVNKKAVDYPPLDLGEVRIGGSGAVKDAIVVSDKDITAFVMSGPKMLPEIWTESGGKLTQLTHLNDNAPKSTARIESIEWDNEGFHVQGWLTYPTNYDQHKKYPMIVTVHGGPSASAFPRGAGQWSGLGYFEFQPNPRGSFGEGEKFTAANIKDFGYGDLRDILTGIDAIEKKVSIDDKRVGMTGWSYGGFMSMFAETQTHRFRAIVAGAGLSDWLSYYGENSIDQWMIPFFGASVYDDPAVYAKSSAITYIKNAKTPMLIIVGDRDGECPAPQSFEMWHALRDLGVKTQLVVYPNEGHGFRDPKHIQDRNERTVKWFADNMPESK
jgi:dipeptidyl aminopeptidase/acylaminoacyl peptidase